MSRKVVTGVCGALASPHNDGFLASERLWTFEIGDMEAVAFEGLSSRKGWDVRSSEGSYDQDKMIRVQSHLDPIPEDRYRPSFGFRVVGRRRK